jgi:uncharacterized lipoprotein YajG
MIRKIKMKIIVILTSSLLLTGCSILGTKDYQYYVEGAKSISKDNTIAQTACWNAVVEIVREGDNDIKISAVALAEKCKNEVVKVEPPQKKFLNF